MSINIPMNELLKVIDKRDPNKSVELNGFEADSAIWRKPYTLTIPKKPVGITSFTVSCTNRESNCGQAATSIASGINNTGSVTGTVLYGDTLSVTPLLTIGYEYKAGVTQFTFSGVTLDSNNKVIGCTNEDNTGSISITAPTLKKYKVYYPAMPVGVSQFEIHIADDFMYDTKLVDNPTSAGSIEVAHGTKLYAIVTRASGFESPTITGISTNSATPTTVIGDIGISTTAPGIVVTPGAPKAYTLSISSIEGVSSQTIRRTSSPYKGAATGTLITGATIYYGDVLSISATAEDKYGLPTVTSPVTIDTSMVDSNNNINTSQFIKAGDYKKYTITIVSSNTTYGTVDTSSLIVGHGTVLMSNNTSGSGSEIKVIGLTSVWIPPAGPNPGYWTTVPDLTILAKASPVESAAINGNFDGWLLDGSPDTDYPKFTHTVKDNMTITAKFSGVPQTYTVSFTNPTYGKWNSSSLTLPYNTTWSVNNNVITFTTPSNGAVTNTVNAGTPTAHTLTFAPDANSRGSWSPTSSVSVNDYVYTRPTISGSATGTITGTKTFTASDSRSATVITNSLSTTPTNSSTSGNHVWTISGETSSGASFERKFTSTAHTSYFYYVIAPNLSGTNVLADAEFKPTVGRMPHSYTLTISSITGVASQTVKRTASPYAGLGTGTLSNGATIYYGDTLSISATATSGYNTPEVTSPVTVTGNVATATYVKAGSTVTTLKAPTMSAISWDNDQWDEWMCITVTNSNTASVTANILVKDHTGATLETDTFTLAAGGSKEWASDYASTSKYYVIECYFTVGSVSSSTTSKSYGTIPKYTVTIVNPSYGKVQVTGGDGSAISTGAKIEYGTSLTVIPNSSSGGYSYSCTYPGQTSGGTGSFIVTGNATITFNRQGITYYVYYEQGNATSGTLPSTQSRVFPNAVTLGTNNMAKSNVTANSYTVTYDQGNATSGTLPSTQTSTNTTTYTKNGWTTSAAGYNKRDYANGASYGADKAENLTLYPNFTTSTTNSGVTLGANTMTRSNTTANSYKVTYYQGNASSITNLPATQTSVNTTKYTANGWAKLRLAMEPDYANNDGTGALTENLTLYPYFTASTTNGGVTLSSNTMSRSTEYPAGFTLTYAKGTASSSTVPTAQTATDTLTYSHDGWATSVSGAKAYNKGASTGALSADVSLYPYFGSARTRGSVTLATNSMTKSSESIATYTVTLSPNGGRWFTALDKPTGGGAVTYPDGSGFGDLSDPTGTDVVTTSKIRTYTANGWTTTSGSTSRTYTNGQSVQLTSNITVYPCFSYADNVTPIALPDTSSLSRNGYTFSGWATSSSATSGTTGNYTPTGNVTLYAVWTPIVSYVYYNQGLATSGTLPNTQSRTYPNAVTLATNNMSKSNTTANSYTVTYANGTATSGTLPSAQTSINTTTYTKNGWTTGSTNTNDPDYANGASYGASSTTNLTLYPNFTTATTNGGVTLGTNNMAKSNTTANSYTVAYAQGNASSTTNLPATQTSINTTTYTKNGWTTTSGSQTRTYANGAATGAMSGNITLYPCFTQSTTNGGVTVSSNKMSRSNTTESGYSVTYAKGTATSTTVPSVQTATNTRSYTQSGWATSKDGSKAYNLGAATGALSSNKTLYPYFDSAISTYGSVKLAANIMTKNSTNDYSYTVTYNYGGNGQNNSTATATKVRTYTANGWTTTSGSQTQTHAELVNTQLTSNLTLYPCFTESTSGGSVALPTPNTRTGYTFNGWYTAASGGTKVGDAGASYTPSGNITLYAQWSQLTLSAPVINNAKSWDYQYASFNITNNNNVAVNVKTYLKCSACDEGDCITGYYTTQTIAANSTATLTYDFKAEKNWTACEENIEYQISFEHSSFISSAVASGYIGYRTFEATVVVPAMPTGVSSFTVYVNGTAKVTNPTAETSFIAAYGDNIYATATATTGYNNPTIGGVSTSSTSPTTMDGYKTTITLTVGAVKQFTLTISEVTGVNIRWVKRTASPLGKGGLGIFSSTVETVYYGDVIEINAYEAYPYGPPNVISPITVTGNIDIRNYIMAGEPLPVLSPPVITNTEVEYAQGTAADLKYGCWLAVQLRNSNSVTVTPVVEWAPNHSNYESKVSPISANSTGWVGCDTDGDRATFTVYFTAEGYANSSPVSGTVGNVETLSAPALSSSSFKSNNGADLNYRLANIASVSVKNNNQKTVTAHITWTSPNGSALETIQTANVYGTVSASATALAGNTVGFAAGTNDTGLTYSVYFSASGSQDSSAITGTVGSIGGGDETTT